MPLAELVFHQRLFMVALGFGKRPVWTTRFSQVVVGVLRELSQRQTDGEAEVAALLTGD